VVDGDSVPRAPLETLREGGAAPVALLTGTTRDEWKLFGFWDPKLRDLDEPGLVAKLQHRIPGCDASALVATYKRARDGGAPVDPASLFFAIETDRIFRIPAIRLAEAQCAHQERVFVYQFNWESPMLGGVLGACHAVELPFVFGALHKEGADQFVGNGPEAETLEQRVMDAWIAFATSGTPGHDALDGWRAYDLDRRATMMLGRTCAIEHAPADAERRIWDGIL
jgi:para-nitrobenzyl esterase